MANLYSVRPKDTDSHVLVIEETARKARNRAWRVFYKAGIGLDFYTEFTEMRVKLLEKHVPQAVGVYDTDDEEWTQEWYCRLTDDCECRHCREGR